MKFIILITVLSLTTASNEEYLEEMDEFSHLEVQPEEIHPEIQDGYEEANLSTETEEYLAKTDEEPTNPEIHPTFYQPTEIWDKWIQEHLTETILWSVIGVLGFIVIGLTCCLFDISHLLYNLLRNETPF